MIMKCVLRLIYQCVCGVCVFGVVVCVCVCVMEDKGRCAFVASNLCGQFYFGCLLGLQTMKDFVKCIYSGTHPREKSTK